MQIDPGYYRKDELCSGDLWEWMKDNEPDYGPELVKLIDSIRYWVDVEECISDFRQVIFRAELDAEKGESRYE